MAKQIKGILGEKLGMTQVWDENNRVVPVTVVKAATRTLSPRSVRTMSTVTRRSRSPSARSTRAR